MTIVRRALLACLAAALVVAAPFGAGALVGAFYSRPWAVLGAVMAGLYFVFVAWVIFTEGDP